MENAPAPARGSAHLLSSRCLPSSSTLAVEMLCLEALSWCLGFSSRPVCTFVSGGKELRSVLYRRSFPGALGEGDDPLFCLVWAPLCVCRLGSCCSRLKRDRRPQLSVQRACGFCRVLRKGDGSSDDGRSKRSLSGASFSETLCSFSPAVDLQLAPALLQENFTQVFCLFTRNVSERHFPLRRGRLLCVRRHQAPCDGRASSRHTNMRLRAKEMPFAFLALHTATSAAH